MKDDWLIDGNVNLTAECNRAEWHHATAISHVKKAGLSEPDATAFVAFAFGEKAEIRDFDPEEELTDAQWNRLSLET